MGSIKEPLGTFYLDGYILCHIFHNEWTKWTKIAWMTTVNKLKNQSGRLENTAKFKFMKTVSREPVD